MDTVQKHIYSNYHSPSSEPYSAALSNAAPSISTLFEPIININSNFNTKNILECLSTVKYFHIIVISSSSTY
jgi:hypothetical protein